MLQVKIYGGDKIGGCVTEMKTDKSKIIFDYGNNLDDTEQIDIEGLTYGEVSYDAVVISHYHLDHIGNVYKVLNKIPIYIEETTKKLYDIICDFSNKPRINAVTFKFGETFKIGDFEITAYKVDHSAYNSAMFLVTDGIKKALYTGDFRDNGYTGKLFIPTLQEVGNVDILITEGTNVGSNSHINKKEESLIDEFADILKKYSQVFVFMSASNIDRITTIQKACNKSKITFIQDLYMAHLTSLIKKEDNVNIPNPVTFNNVLVYKPKYFMKKDKAFLKKYFNTFDNKNSNSMLYKPFVMNIRTSMLQDLEMFNFKKDILTNACLVYSMWGNYKEKEDIKNFLGKVEQLGIKVIEKDLHVSGHANEELIDQVKNITNAKEIFVIHTEKLK